MRVPLPVGAVQPMEVPCVNQKLGGRERVRACVCACVRERARAFLLTLIHAIF